MRARWIVAALLIVLASAAFALRNRGPARVAVDIAPVTRQAQFRSTVTASGEIVAVRYADIGSSVMGKIVSLPVAEGDRVKAGQVLARIDAVQAQADVSGAREQVAALEADVQASAGQVRAATAELAAAEARARDADQQLTRKRGLHEAGLLPALDFETARAAADNARAQVASARAAVERARATQDASTRRVAQARAQQQRAGDVLAKTSILAPIDGIVSRLRVREGEMVVIGIQNQPGTTLMTISDLEDINAELKVAEADVLRLALGQRATVTLESMTGRRFDGHVAEIGASALPVSGTGAAAREFKVAVRLDKPDASLRPGLTCDAEIVTTERTNVLTVPLQSVVLRTVDGKERPGVFVERDGRAVFTPVTPGVIGGLEIEIAGLDERASVIVGPYQALRELQDGAAVKPNPTGR
ncbi:MAG TPA: efflux RND transporter periplasmic adaptor subunit [Vicinamibacterales bacterium]